MLQKAISASKWAVSTSAEESAAVHNQRGRSTQKWSVVTVYVWRTVVAMNQVLNMIHWASFSVYVSLFSQVTHLLTWEKNIDVSLSLMFVPVLYWMAIKQEAGALSRSPLFACAWAPYPFNMTSSTCTVLYENITLALAKTQTQTLTKS